MGEVKAQATEFLRLVKAGWESPWRARRNVRRILETPIIRARLRLLGVRVEPGVRFFGSPIVQRYRQSEITIGGGSELRSGLTSNVLGLAHPVILTTLTSAASIRIGERAGLSGASLCAAASITVGKGALVGADVLITDTDHHSLSGQRNRLSLEGVATEPIWIGADVFIGARAIVLKGSRIGDGAVVGAGAVVAGDIPSGAIFAGNPARHIGWVDGASAKGARSGGPIGAQVTEEP